MNLITLNFFASLQPRLFDAFALALNLITFDFGLLTLGSPLVFFFDKNYNQIMNNGTNKFMRVIILSVILCLSAPIQTFADNWTMSSKNIERNAIITSTADPNLEARWTKSATGSSVYMMPIYQDGIFYFSERISSTSWKVSAVNKSAGVELWHYDGVGNLFSDITISGDYIVVSLSASIVCLSVSDGHEVWEVANSRSKYYYSFSNPLIFNATVYVWNSYGSSGYVSAYHVENGTTAWQNEQFFPVAAVWPFSISGDNLIITHSTGSNYSNISSYTLAGSKNWGPLSIPRNPSGAVVVDGNIGFFSTNSGSINKIDLSIGKLLSSYQGYANATMVATRNGHAYFLSTSQYQSGKGNTYLNDWIYTTSDPPARKKTFIDLFTHSSDKVLLYGNKLYFANALGQIVAYDTVENTLERFSITSGLSLNKIMVADDVFVTMDSTSKNLFFSTDVGFSVGSESRIEIDSPYSCIDCNQYLGQLHSHYIPDMPAVAEAEGYTGSASYTENKYKEAGYDFVALTEHNKVVSDPGVGGILHIQDSEENTQGQDGNHILGVGINSSVGTDSSDQERLSSYYNQGGLVIAPHPNLKNYQWKTVNLLNLKDYHSIEIFNTGVDVAGRYLDGLPTSENYKFYDKATATDKWDELLSRGKKVWGTAADDYTPGNPGFDGGAVMISAESNSQADVLDALKSGSFYTLQGSAAPKLQVEVGDNSIRISSDQASNITFIGKDGKVLKEERYVMGSTYYLVGDEKYVRAEVLGANGKKSWTQPIFINKIASAKSDWIGKQKLILPHASLLASSSGNLSVNSLAIKDYPAVLPSLGLYSPIYSLMTNGTLSGPAELELDYADQILPFPEGSLSLYTFNETTSVWDKVLSTVDTITKKVRASLNHFSYYALSSDFVDVEKPEILIDDLGTIEYNPVGNELEIAATDASRIVSVSGYIDGKLLLFEDKDESDGFVNTVDFSKVFDGVYTLTLLAEDYFGNIAENEYSFLLTGNKEPIVPVIEEDKLADKLPVINKIESIPVNASVPIESSRQSAVKIEEIADTSAPIQEAESDTRNQSTESAAAIEETDSVQISDINGKVDSASSNMETKESNTFLMLLIIYCFLLLIWMCTLATRQLSAKRH